MNFTGLSRRLSYPGLRRYCPRQCPKDIGCEEAGSEEASRRYKLPQTEWVDSAGQHMDIAQANES